MDHVTGQRLEIIEEGVSTGEFKTQTPGLVSKALLGVLNWTITWYREDGPLSTKEIADYFTELFLQGLYLRE